MTPAEWTMAPSHVGPHGNEMRDQLSGVGVKKHGIRMRGQQEAAWIRQAECSRGREDEEVSGVLQVEGTKRAGQLKQFLLASKRMKEEESAW